MDKEREALRRKILAGRRDVLDLRQSKVESRKSKAAVSPATPLPRKVKSRKSKVESRKGKRSFKLFTLNFLQYVLVAVGSLVLAYNATIGQWLILAYAIFVLIRRVDSRQPLIGALVLLVAIPLFQIINLEAFAENAAIYAYELLVLGVLTAAIELWRQKPVQNRLRGDGSG